jgi:hypothetical protein
MKIFEIVSESKFLYKGVGKSLSNLQTYPQLDVNDNPYLAYRFGIALAGSPARNMDKYGPIGSEFTTVGYSDGDQEIIDNVAKHFGVKPNIHGKKGSVESTGTNTVSPVAKPKRNKYGV